MTPGSLRSTVPYAGVSASTPPSDRRTPSSMRSASAVSQAATTTSARRVSSGSSATSPRNLLATRPPGPAATSRRPGLDSSTSASGLPTESRTTSSMSCRSTTPQSPDDEPSRAVVEGAELGNGDAPTGQCAGERRTGGDEYGGWLISEPSYCEQQRRQRRLIDPVRVVDRAKQGRPPGKQTEHRQHTGADIKLRHFVVGQGERTGQGPGLWVRQLLEQPACAPNRSSSPPYAISLSDSTPVSASCAKPSARPRAHASSADLPMPGSPT